MDAEYVTSGKAAVTRVKSALQRHTCYNIALVDWKMPDMDGVETARSIRRIVGPDTLVIIMSAYDWTEIEARAREAGVDFFISKPIFQSVVQECCSSHAPQTIRRHASRAERGFRGKTHPACGRQ